LTGLLAILLLSFLVERVLEQLKPLFPRRSRSKVLPIVGMALGVLLSFATSVGILTRLGLLAVSGSGWQYAFDRILTGLLIGGGSEPIHSLIVSLQYKKESLKGIK